MAMTAGDRQRVLVEDYLLIEDPRERFQIIVETAASHLEPFPDEFRNEDHLVPGCVSKVWIALWEGNDGAIELRIDSESPALRSLGALYCRLYAGAKCQDIMDTEPDFIETLKIDLNLTPTRMRGLRRLRERIIESVAGLLEHGSHD